MLFSIALLLLCGMAFSRLAQTLRLPGLVGMLVAGILLGPGVLGLLDASLLSVAGDLRRAALLFILLRAGLSLHPEDLRRVGRPAILLCFVPACFEIAGYILFAPRFLGLSLPEAALLGTVIGAVSPAVIVPKMLRLMDEKYGTAQSIPQMILAGASADDVFVIVLFSAALGLVQGESISPLTVLTIPVSIVLGLAGGALVGTVLGALLRRFHVRDTSKMLLLIALAFLLVGLEDRTQGGLPFSGLLAVMSMGIAVQKQRADAAERLNVRFSKVWVGAEVLLFTLVGADVEIGYVAQAGLATVALVLLCLLFRAAGVLLATAGGRLRAGERAFCVMAYLPKATVQAAIGSTPLAMGLACGRTVLTAAVVAILLTAPLGAFLIENTYRRLLRPAGGTGGA